MYRTIRYMVLIALVGLLSNSINASNNVAGAILNYHQGDFETAMFQFQQIADQVDTSQAAKANYMLGKMYERGDGVLIDDQIAYSYYKKSAKSGDPDAVQRLQEFGSDESIVQDWYMEAAWDGDVEAQYSLGYLYETGMGVQIDKARAIQWYGEAAKKQHAGAQFRLGLMLISLDAENRDLVSGKFWLTAAAENGSDVADAIVQELFGNVSDQRIIQAVQGVRTYEQSSPELMLAVISNAVNLEQTKLEASARIAKRAEQRNIAQKKKQRIEFEKRIAKIESVASTPDLKTNSESVAVKTNSNAIVINTSKPEVNELQLLTPEYIANPESFVATKLTTDAEFNAFVEEQVSASTAWELNWSTVSFLIGLFLLGVFLWHKKYKFDQRHFKMVSLSSGAVQSDPEEDMSALLERLMSDPFAEVSIKEPVSQPAPVGSTSGRSNVSGLSNKVTAKSAKPVSQQMNMRKETLEKEEEKRKERTEQLFSAQLTSKQSTPKQSMPKGLPIKLAYENFMPSASSDVVLRRRKAGAVLLPVDNISIAAVDGSHAIDEEVVRSHTRQSVHGVIEQSKQESNMPGITPINTQNNVLDDAKQENKKQVNANNVTPNTTANEELSKPQSMSALSDFLNKESGGEEMNDMVLADSYFNIGMMFIKGDGVALNTKLGSRWLQKAVDKGHRVAKIELEIIQSYEQAPEYLQGSFAVG